MNTVLIKTATYRKPHLATYMSVLLNIYSEGESQPIVFSQYVDHDKSNLEIN